MFSENDPITWMLKETCTRHHLGHGLNAFGIEFSAMDTKPRSSEAVEVTGLPFVCNNCGVSFFSLHPIGMDDECYCSGECKWSVIMYREMDERIRRHEERFHSFCSEEATNSAHSHETAYTEDNSSSG
jgi:hypothetical protein